MISLKFVMTWYRGLKGKIRFSVPLKGYTTFKIGGPAKYFIEPEDIDDLRFILGLIKKRKFPFLMIGCGSNILVSDTGLNYAVIKLSSAKFSKISVQGKFLEVGSGALLNRLVFFCREKGLSGIEFLVGIPGTLGGALLMNAGAWGMNISNIVDSVTVIDSKLKVKTLSKKKIDFGYRKSRLSKYIILSARLRFLKEDKRIIRNRIREVTKLRKQSQDLAYPSAGCIFKNPSADSSGRLIEECGLKGLRIGGASVSLKHANFILNLNRASSQDVLKLINFVQSKVKAKFNINLKPEIKIWK